MSLLPRDQVTLSLLQELILEESSRLHVEAPCSFRTSHSRSLCLNSAFHCSTDVCVLFRAQIMRTSARLRDTELCWWQKTPDSGRISFKTSRHHSPDCFISPQTIHTIPNRNAECHIVFLVQTGPV